MSGEPAYIGVLRESVEAEVTPSVASAAMFAALAEWGPRVPSSFAEVVDLVRGPLRRELAKRLGDARAAELEKRLEARLRLAEMPTGTIASAPRESFEDVPTHALPRPEGPVLLRVVAASPVLETLILSALGPRRVELEGDAPDILLLDATDAPASWGADLELRAHAAPLTLLYGADTAQGRALAARLGSASVAFLGFDVEHGAGPILDLLRSRAA
ncbi:MAG: hypothetical protein KF729_18010 [Sandaracinaceae bacterium]|nr:hypothetical protein [Sandaracinaceae bacterium]